MSGPNGQSPIQQQQMLVGVFMQQDGTHNLIINVLPDVALQVLQNTVEQLRQQIIIAKLQADQRIQVVSPQVPTLKLT